jgi:hypothetical protein
MTQDDNAIRGLAGTGSGGMRGGRHGTYNLVPVSDPGMFNAVKEFR